MSTVVGERFALVRARLRGWRRRVTGLGLALRASLLVSGVAAIGLPSFPVYIGLVLAAVLPVVAMARPFGAWVWAVQLTAVTAAALHLPELPLALAFATGAAVYVHHAAAALAAMVRADAAVEIAVLRGWVWRQWIVLAAAAVTTAAMAILAGQRLPVPPEALAVLATLGALAVPVAIVASLSRR